MNLNNIAGEILGQLGALLCQINQENYVRPVKVLSSSAIGQHVRHVIECFNCFLTGYENGEVNYDNRRRDKRIEEDKELASGIFQDIIIRLAALDPDKKLILTVNYSTDDNLRTLIETTAARELAYNIEHAIHHMALIKIGVKDICPDLEIPEYFGVAYSTIKHQHKLCAQ